jgi:hypothetical protein
MRGRQISYKTLFLWGNIILLNKINPIKEVVIVIQKYNNTCAMSPFTAENVAEPIQPETG